MAEHPAGLMLPVVPTCVKGIPTLEYIVRLAELAQAAYMSRLERLIASFLAAATVRRDRCRASSAAVVGHRSDRNVARNFVSRLMSHLKEQSQAKCRHEMQRLSLDH